MPSVAVDDGRGRPAPGRSWRLPAPVRIDARRPATWIAAATAAIAGCVLMGGADSAPHIVAAAWLVGALATVAAIGDLPMELCAGAAGGRTRCVAAWLWQRSAWPAAGMLVAWTFAAPAGAAGGGAAMVAMAAAVAVTAAVVLAARLRHANAADAASLAIAGGCGTAALLLWMARGRPPADALAAVSLGWAGTGIALLAAARLQSLAAGWNGGWHGEPTLVGGLPPRTAEGLWFGVLPAQGPLRRLLTRVAMGSSLAAMVGWLFLDPGRTSLYGLLAGGWFVALAVPRAALLDGMAAAGSWAGVLRSAAADPSRRPLAALAGRPLPAAFSTHVAVSAAAILGWPPLVAAALSAGDPDRGWRLAAIALALAAAAAALVAIAAAFAALGASAETLLAGLLALTVAVVIAAATLPPSLPHLPP